MVAVTGAASTLRHLRATAARVLDGLAQRPPLLPEGPSALGTTRRVAIACCVGVVAALATAWMPHAVTFSGAGLGDIAAPMVGFKAYLEGGSAYSVRLRGAALAAYPFPTMLVLSPLLALPRMLAAPLFVGLGFAALAWGLLARGAPWRLLTLVSAPALSSIHSVQWAPLIVAGLLVPALAPFAVAKPQQGILVVAFGRWRRAGLAAALAVVVASFVLYPAWPADWIRNGQLSSYPGRIPVLTAVGPLVLLAALVWRSPRARLVLLLAFLPQRYFYDQLALLLVAARPLHLVALILVGWLGALTCAATGAWSPSSGTQPDLGWLLVLATSYLPAVVCVLGERRRPVAASSDLPVVTIEERTSAQSPGPGVAS